MQEPAELETTTASESDGRRRRWLLVSALVAVVVLVAIVAVGFSTHWFRGSDSSASSRLVKSDPRALAAAVIADLPYGVSVTWASGSGKLGRAAGAGSALQGGFTDFLLLTWDNHQYLLSVEVSTNPSGTSLPSMNGTRFGRDSEGRAQSMFVTHWFSDHMVEVSEFAGPGGAGDLPLQQSDGQRIVHNTLVSVQTTQGTFDGSRELATYRTKMPVVKWFMSGNYGS